MPAMKCLSKVIAVKQLTHDVKEISLRMIAPTRVIFKAGQYIAIEVTEIKEGRPRQNNRPYSIVSPPEEPEVIKLCVNLVPGGPGSTYLHNLQIGDEVPFLYPLGYFIIKNDNASALIFVATGTGIAPIQSMIKHLINRGSQRKMTLYWGLRQERDLYYQAFYIGLAEKHPFFHYKPTLSQPSSEWRGLRGRVTEHISKNIVLNQGEEAYLCGNGTMIREVRAMLLEKGLTKQSIHFEKYY
ncbi:MAG: FAD-binding oxidoreductase [Nitrospiria bacterium]